MSIKKKYLADGTYIVVPDLQVPYHNKPGVAALIAAIKDIKPDGLLCVGDEADCMEIGRWIKGSKHEYAGTLEQAYADTYDIMYSLQTALNGHDSGDRPLHVQRSNHTDRQKNYVKTFAPALDGTTWNAYERIVGYNGHTPLIEGRYAPLPNTTFHHEFFNFAKGWIMAHGDEGPISRMAGGTALGLAKQTGYNVLCGHTHRAGIQHENTGALGVLTQRLIGVEVGNLMDIDQAGYLKHGYTNWQMAFGVLHITNGIVNPHLVLEQQKAFRWSHQTYKWGAK